MLYLCADTATFNVSWMLLAAKVLRNICKLKVKQKENATGGV